MNENDFWGIRMKSLLELKHLNQNSFSHKILCNVFLFSALFVAVFPEINSLTRDRDCKIRV